MAYARLTTAEYEALLSLLPPRTSLSDLCRELLSEAVVARVLAHERAARSAPAV